MALALGVLALLPGAALAEGEAQSYRAASERLNTLVAAADTAGSAELLQGGEMDQLVTLLSDARFLDSAPDLGTLVEYCGREQQAVSALLVFGLKARLDAKTTPEQAAKKLDKAQVENADRFGRQLGLLHPFLVRCNAAEVAPMTRFVAGLKPAELTLERQQGFAQFHAGLERLFSDTLRLARDDRYADSYRLAVLQALAQGAPALAGAMPLAARKQQRPDVDTTLAAAPDDFAPALKAIGAALDDPRCEGLCGY